jgi:RND superfamily putative drug exporter
MKIGIPEASVLPEKYESRAGDDILKQDFDYASLYPMQIVATVQEGPLSAEGLEDIKQLGQSVRETDGVRSVESIYTIGETAARQYAEEVSKARTEAEAEARGRIDALVEERYNQLEQEQIQKEVEEQTSQLAADQGTLPPGAEEQIRSQVEQEVSRRLEESGAREQIRAEVESEVQQRIDEQVPDLPDGISANGEITAQGVANFMKLPEARESEELQGAKDDLVAGDLTLLRSVTEASPYVGAARETVGDVRSVEPPKGVSFLVGGLSAGQKDFISSVYGKAPYAAAFVLGVTYLVLLYTFRSVILPLKAVAVNILSLTASFGAMVFVFQDGNFSKVLNFTPLGFVDATLPILMFCTVFGVSMDYEVFLLSRIREAYENGDSNTASVAKGLVSTAGIITSAAAIIIVVTGAFTFSSVIITKAVGLGLAVAVFVDATIIRVLLVPATMRVLGKWNWWPGGRKRSRTVGVSHRRRSPRTDRFFDILNMPIVVLGVLLVVVAVNLFLYFGYYSKTSTPLPAEHTVPSTTIEKTERTGPKEGTRPERTRPATTLQNTIPTDQRATASATSSP